MRSETRRITSSAVARAFVLVLYLIYFSPDRRNGISDQLLTSVLV